MQKLVHAIYEASKYTLVDVNFPDLRGVFIDKCRIYTSNGICLYTTEIPNTPFQRLEKGVLASIVPEKRITKKILKPKRIFFDPSTFFLNIDDWCFYYTEVQKSLFFKRFQEALSWKEEPVGPVPLPKEFGKVLRGIGQKDQQIDSSTTLQVLVHLVVTPGRLQILRYNKAITKGKVFVEEFLEQTWDTQVFLDTEESQAFISPYCLKKLLKEPVALSIFSDKVWWHYPNDTIVVQATVREEKNADT